MRASQAHWPFIVIRSPFALGFTALLRKLHLKAFLEILNVLMRVLLSTSEAKKKTVLGVAYHSSMIVTSPQPGNPYINCIGFRIKP